MIKLPERKYVPKHNDELKRYAKGWNTIINNIECWCNILGEEKARKLLLTEKEISFKYEYDYATPTIYKGAYDCIVEIERLNEEVESEHRLDNFFKDSLEALDKLNIRGE